MSRGSVEDLHLSLYVAAFWIIFERSSVNGDRGHLASGGQTTRRPSDHMQTNAELQAACRMLQEMQDTSRGSNYGG